MDSQSPADSFLSLRSSPAGAAVGSAILGSDIIDELERSRSVEEDALVSEVGQLSLNEEREVRFHGQASGLHLLDVKERVDGRNEGGIWWVLCTLKRNWQWDFIDYISGVFRKPVSGQPCRSPSIVLACAVRDPSLYQTPQHKRDCWKYTSHTFTLHYPFSTNRAF